MKRSKKILAIVLALALIGSLAGVSAFAAVGKAKSEAKTDTKADSKTDTQSVTAAASSAEAGETVYVIAGADGHAEKVIVSQQYADDDTKAAQKAKDTLTDAQSVKGEACWQGTSDKPLPVTMSVSYTLDGKAVSPEALAGKSGHVTIRFDYTNSQYETKVVNGRAQKIYVPFAVLTGALLDSDRFSHVSVTNGKLVEDGSHTAVVGMAFPGLQESLDLSTDKLEIPTYVEIEADVQDFTLDTTLTLVSNGFFNDMKDEELDTGELDSLSSDMDKLTDAMTQLIDGSGELYDGLDTLLSSSKKLANGVDQLTSGLKKLDANSAALNDGAAQVFNTLLDTVNTQLQGNAELKEAVEAAGGEVPTLTIANYAEEMQKLINVFDQDKVVEQATAVATQKVTAAVEANRSKIQAGVTAAVEQQVTAQVTAGAQEKISAQAAPQVTAAVQQQVTAKVTAAVQQQVLAAVLETKSLTQEQYEQLPAERKAAIDAAVDAQMKTEEVQGQIAATVAQQMETEEIQAAITQKTNEAVAAQMETEAVKKEIAATVAAQMKTEEVQAIIAQNTEAMVQQTIRENMASDEVQNQIKAAAAKAGTAAETLTAAKLHLDSYNTFYTGLLTYTAGVAELKAGAVKLDNSMPELISGVRKLRSGAGELADGLKELNEEGIRKLTDAVNGDLSGLGDRLDAISDVSESYRGFTTDSGSVKFIFRTASIEAAQ